MKRLLCIINSLNVGGAETFLMKIHRNIDKTKYQIDFCVMSDEIGVYEDEVIARGGRIFHIVSKSENPVKCFCAIRRIVKENGYKYAIRMNASSLTVIDLIAAKSGGAKVLVMRSSNAGILSKRNDFLHKLFMFLAKIVPNVKIAPSLEAAEYTFGKGSMDRGKVHMLNNGLDFDLYRFDPDKRNALRKELGIENCFAVGHIGRFSEQKNHDFLIDVFSCVCKKNNNAKLLLVGVGELEHSVREKVKKLGIEDKVVFLGRRSDVPDLMSAFDVLLFPSFHEGMPNVVIEAQAAGLPCVISATITSQADITGLVKYLPLDLSAENWANEVLTIPISDARADTRDKFYNAGYDQNSVTKEFIRLIFERDMK